MRVTILGCGASGGVPLINGEWGNCNPANQKNHRRRPSILVQEEDTTILVDASPDMRMQLLDAGCSSLTALLITHEHFDHVGGLDDLRVFYFRDRTPLPLYTSSHTLEALHERFAYIFKPNPQEVKFYPCFLAPCEIDSSPFQVGKIEVQAFVQDHYFCESLGFKFNQRIAYSTDIATMTAQTQDHLWDLDIWIVDCATMHPTKNHSHLEQTLQWIERFKPKKAYLTHMQHTMDYEALQALLPENVFPCYDGLVIEG